MENTMKKGLILGGLLATVAAIGFSMTESAKELSEDLEKDLKSVGKHMKKALSNLKDMTKEKYDALVETVVDQYSQEKKLVTRARNQLVHSLQQKWNEMEAEYKADHKK